MAQIEYYLIFRWMREELHLEGTELHCYAIIYSLSKGDNWYNAGVQNMIDVLGKSKPTIINALGSLTEKELVVKVPVLVNNAKRYYYKATKTFDDDTLKILKEAGLNNLTEGRLNGLTKGGLNNLTPINKVNNKEIKEKRLSNDNQKKGVSSSRFVKPKIEQVEAYIQEKGYHFDAEHFWNYYESKGWKVGNSPMKNWKAACATWESKRKSDNLIKSEEQQNADEEDRKLWEKQKEWLEKNLPNIAPEITQDIMLEMRHISLCDRYILQDTLEELNKVYDGGDIIQKFKEVMR